MCVSRCCNRRLLMHLQRFSCCSSSGRLLLTWWLAAAAAAWLLVGSCFLGLLALETGPVLVGRCPRSLGVRLVCCCSLLRLQPSFLCSVAGLCLSGRSFVCWFVLWRAGSEWQPAACQRHPLHSSTVYRQGSKRQAESIDVHPSGFHSSSSVWARACACVCEVSKSLWRGPPFVAAGGGWCAACASLVAQAATQAWRQTQDKQSSVLCSRVTRLIVAVRGVKMTAHPLHAVLGVFPVHPFLRSPLGWVLVVRLCVGWHRCADDSWHLLFVAADDDRPRVCVCSWCELSSSMEKEECV